MFTLVSNRHSADYHPHYHIVKGHITNQDISSPKITFKTANNVHILINRHRHTSFLGHRDIDMDNEVEDRKKAEFELRFKQG